MPESGKFAALGWRLRMLSHAQEEPSPTTGISIPAYTAALGLEAGAQAFAAAKGGQAPPKIKEVTQHPRAALSSPSITASTGDICAFELHLHYSPCVACS